MMHFALARKSKVDVFFLRLRNPSTFLSENSPHNDASLLLVNYDNHILYFACRSQLRTKVMCFSLAVFNAASY